MNRKLLCLLLACVGYLALADLESPASNPPAQVARAIYSAQVGGVIAPDGKTEIQCDLPASLQKHNIAVHRLGCCVFRSADHSGRYQNVPAVYGMPEWMQAKGIPGGGYPEKLAKLVKQIAQERGLPEPVLVQAEGQQDMAFLNLAHKTGRMAMVTYSRSPTGRYSGQKIAHMVNLAHADPSFVAVLDNNYICTAEQPDAYEWMTPAEFLRTCNPGGYWGAVFLAPPPPPVPAN